MRKKDFGEGVEATNGWFRLGEFFKSKEDIERLYSGNGAVRVISDQD